MKTATASKENNVTENNEATLNAWQVIALRSVLSLHLQVGENKGLGISARQALKNVGLLKPRQRLTDELVRHYLTQCEAQLAKWAEERAAALASAKVES